jgi:hypothetical protein
MLHVIIGGTTGVLSRAAFGVSTSCGAHTSHERFPIPISFAIRTTAIEGAQPRIASRS